MIVIKTTKNDQTKYKYFYSASADLRNKIQNKMNRIKTYDIIIKHQAKHKTYFTKLNIVFRGHEFKPGVLSYPPFIIKTS